jgi:DNA mismatch repair protein MutS
MNSEATTPLMHQYHAVKRQVPGALLMFRLGDFYELFYEDAVTAARELEITLTSRHKEQGRPVPMCGVPYHAAESYIARLVARGYRVALCDQMEDPRRARKLVRREITRIITPGTATDPALLPSRENNYLAAVFSDGRQAGLAWVDVSTGEFRAAETEAAEAGALLEALPAREVLLPAGASLASWQAAAPLLTEREPWSFDYEHAERTLLDHYRLHSLDGCGLAGRRLAVCAAGAVLEYLRETQRAALEHLEPPRYFDRSDSMRLDAVTVRNLELLEPLFPAEPAGVKEASLLGVMDRTQTGMGGRLLRSRLLRPSLERAEIEARLDAVEELLAETILRSELRKELGQIADLERLLAKVTLGTAGPREMLALGRSLERLPGLKRILGARRSARLRALAEGLETGRTQRAHPRHPGRRAARQPGRRRRHPRRRPPGTGRAARRQPKQPPLHRRNRSARAFPHRHRIAQGALQQRLWLLPGGL